MRWFALIAILVIGPNALACDNKEEGELKSEFASSEVATGEHGCLLRRTHIEYLKLLLTDPKGSERCHDQMVKMWGLLGSGSTRTTRKKGLRSGTLKVPPCAENSRRTAIRRGNHSQRNQPRGRRNGSSTRQQLARRCRDLALFNLAARAASEARLRSGNPQGEGHWASRPHCGAGNRAMCSRRLAYDRTLPKPQPKADIGRARSPQSSRMPALWACQTMQGRAVGDLPEASWPGRARSAGRLAG